MEISAKKREILGKKNKELRKNGLIPAVLYSSDSSVGNKEVLNLSLKADDFKKIYQEAGTSALIKLEVEEGPKTNILITQVQVDPVSLDPIHVGLFEVDMKEEVETEVPVQIINDEEHEKVQSGEGIVISLLSDIRVKCLPANIPHEFIVDALELKEIGDVFTAADLKVDPEKVELLVEPEEAIAKLDYAVQEEIEEEGPTSVDEVEVTGGAADREDEKTEESEEKPEADKE